MNPFLKFLQSARNLAKNQDLSKEDVLKFAKNEFGDITGLMRAQIDQIFKPGKQAITKQTDNIVSIKKDKPMKLSGLSDAEEKKIADLLEEQMKKDDFATGENGIRVTRGRIRNVKRHRTLTRDERV